MQTLDNQQGDNLQSDTDPTCVPARALEPKHYGRHDKLDGIDRHDTLELEHRGAFDSLNRGVRL
jgi:hypothetical protein